MSLIAVKNLKKSFHRGDETVHALSGISLNVNAGEFVTIMGKSGSGKSTLLHLIGALDKPTSGEILFENKNIAHLRDAALAEFRRRRLGFIFQFFNLVPTLNAIENVALPQLLDGTSMDKIETRARELLVELGLEKRMHHRPDQLSGGEMQRVAIARALLANPILILADEPTGNLDSKTGQGVLEKLREIAQTRNQTILMVTHDLAAASYGTRVITLKDGQVETDVANVRNKFQPELRPNG